MFSKFNILASVIIKIVCFYDKSLGEINYLPDVHCPNVFQYLHLDSGETIGIITIDGVRHGRTNLIVELSQPGAYSLAYFGKLSLNFSKDKVFEHIDRGRALTFKVEFPLKNVVPRVTSIQMNGIEICAGQKYGSPSTTVKLEYTLSTYPTDSRNNFWYPNFKQESNQIHNEGAPEFSVDYFKEDKEVNPKPSTETIHEIPASIEYINSVCGQENFDYDIIRLNVKGTVIRKSRFPWISAVFKRTKGDYTFQCGGSLISTRTVVSAAHCFYVGLQSLTPENILISMGLHDLTDWLNAYNFAVEKVIQHPDYNPQRINFDADVAVVRLKQSVTFTTSVRPICLWEGSLENSEIEGTIGAIVGWGADNHQNTTIVPTIVKATVVSEITCLRSNYVFSSLISNRTLCAGNRDGSGPCMGDSGNGLMIKKRNKWMLRGTVSAALGTRYRQCILDQYAIYSDIAKFSEWIRLNMLL